MNSVNINDISLYQGPPRKASFPISKRSAVAKSDACLIDRRIGNRLFPDVSNTTKGNFDDHDRIEILDLASVLNGPVVDTNFISTNFKGELPRVYYLERY